jgi:dihydrofolate reductase
VKRLKIIIEVKVQLSIITAIDTNRVIGIQNRLPWSLPADLIRFKRITWGKPIIMGRNTYESIGRPLPGRTNIILSRGKSEFAGCLAYTSLEEALAHHQDEKEIFIIGGANLYEQTISRVDRLYLTIINHQFEGDTYFPHWDHEDWEVLEQEECIPDGQNQFSYVFQTLKRCR